MGTATSEIEGLRAVAIDCYRAAVRNVAFYAVELDREVTARYRASLSRLEQNAETADGDSLPALLRDYRGQALVYVNRLCGQIAETAGSLRRILDSLAEGDGDYEGRMRGALARLRALARSEEAADLRGPLLAAAAAIQGGLDEMCRRQEESVARLLEEIRTLHKRIDSLESAASIDMLATLLTRAEMEERMQSPAAPARRLLLLAAAGLRLAETRFDSQVATQLAAAFLKRLHRILPPESAIGRWSDEEFMVMLPAGEEPAAETEKRIEDQLSGSYACARDGKGVRPSLQVHATMLSAGQAAAPA